jgi:hypothetical protein
VDYQDITPPTPPEQAPPTGEKAGAPPAANGHTRAELNNGSHKSKDEILAAEVKPEMPPFAPENFPANIKDRKQFVCWRWERKQKPNKTWKWDKVPINPRTGRRASSTDPETWGTLKEVWDYYEAHRGAVDGVGVMLGNGISGIDLDKCIDLATDELKPWAASIVLRLSTYMEFSPTLTGIKGLAFGTKTGDRCKTGMPCT